MQHFKVYRHRLLTVILFLTLLITTFNVSATPAAGNPQQNAAPLVQSQTEPPYPPPSFSDIPAEVEEARARAAMESTLDKQLVAWGSEYRAVLGEVKVDGEWAYATAEWQSEKKLVDDSLHILARQLSDGIWQALVPSQNELYLQWLDSVPASLVSLNSKKQINSQLELLAAIYLTSQVQQVSTNNTLEEQVSTTIQNSDIEVAFQEALALHIDLTGSKQPFEITYQQISENFAHAYAQPVDRDIKQSYTPVFVPLLAERSLDLWKVVTPIINPLEYNTLLQMFPSDLLDENTKAFLSVSNDLERVNAYTDFSGHRFPWAFQETSRLNAKDNCYLNGTSIPCNNTGHENQLDFSLQGPGIDGTVHASKAGTVVFVKESSNSGLCDLGDVPFSSVWPKANMVVMQHGENEYSWYVHLAYNSVPVSEGQYIESGTQIGVEGNTGYSCGTHLHYMTSSGHTAWTNQNDPNSAPWATGITSVNFDESSWASLTVGNWYTSQNQGGAPSSNVNLFPLSNYQGNTVFSGGVGFSNLPSADAYSMEIPSGWSVNTWQGDNKSGDRRCWSSSVNNLQDHGWHLAIESIEVYDYVHSDCNIAPPGDVWLYEFANYEGNQVFHGGVGFSNAPSSNSYSMNFTNGMSVETWSEDNRLGSYRCWRTPVTNLQDHGWHLEIESIELHSIDICPPTANFDAWPQTGNTTTPIKFHNTSVGNYTSCLWDYGNGHTGTSCAYYHDYTYIDPGIYTVKLTVTGPNGSTEKTITDYIEIDPPPLQVKLYDQANYGGNNVTSAGSGFSNAPSANSYSMDIPDGWSVKTWPGDNRSGDMRCWQYSISNLQDHGWHLAIESIEVFESNVCPPEANFEASPLSGNAPLEVTFRNTSIGEHTYCSWGYGDDETGSSCNEYHTHTYTTPGIYMVQLFVAGLNGSDTESKIDYITVTSSDPDLYPYSPAGGDYLVIPSSVRGTDVPNTLYAGSTQATYFDWHFINGGTADVTSDFHVEVWVDDTMYIRYPFSYLGAGVFNGFYDWGEAVPDAGWHTVRIVTDPDNVIAESNEDNNEWSGDFYWTADLHEPNNSLQEATPIAYGDALDAEIGPIGDEDFYVFTGSQGDTIIVDIDAESLGSSLDSYIYILDDQGNEITFNDDAEGYDSKLGYTLLNDGTYYIKVRSYSHPYTGGPAHFYTIRFYTDNVVPTASITSPADGAWIDPIMTTIHVDAVDYESGINRVEFLWHSDDWQNSDWVFLGTDSYGGDGWSYNFDSSTLPELRGGAFYIWAFDWGGQYGPDGVYNLGIDRTPPESSVRDLPAVTNNLMLIVVNWSGTDNLSGISSYDVQVRDGSTGDWTDLVSNTSQTYDLMSITNGHTYYFRSRARDEAGNLEAFPPGDGDTFTTIVQNTNCKTLTLNIDPSAGGNITADPPPNCANGTKYTTDTVVELTATANVDYTFANWSDGASGTSAVVSVTMDTDKVVTANFEQVCYTLTLFANPAVGGSINTIPSPNCNNGTQYSSGTVVEITAAPSQGYEFDNWSGDAIGSFTTTLITMNGARAVNAHFSEVETCYSLSLAADPNAGGSIDANPSPNCNNGTQYRDGTIVQLSAASNSDFIFDNWSGDASGTSNPLSMIMNQNKTITAHFSQISGPHLRIYEDTLGYPEQSVDVPIFFSENGDEISSIAFSVNFDESCLAFDDTDADGDGIPDAVSFSVPNDFGKSATFDSSDTVGEIDFLIADIDSPLASMPDGELATIEFTVTCYPTTYHFAEINFATETPPSFGNIKGRSVVGTNEGGGVDVYPLPPVDPFPPGDCNGDYSVDAGDISALSLEIFDNDGINPDSAGGGTFNGGLGCDANEDSVIDAGDITCTVLLIFEGPGACGDNNYSSNATMLPDLNHPIALANGPSLIVPTQVQASSGDEVTIPVTFTANGNDISSVIFSLDFDQSWLEFDSTDSDGDGIPDAIVFDVPGNFDTSVTYNASDTDGELDFFLADIFPPLGSLSDGVMAYITFTVGAPTDDTEAAIQFSQEPAASFGNTLGQSVTGVTTDGSVLIQSNYTVYLPMVVKP